jgi:hypothetical protein
MARFRPADLSAAVKKDREAMRINKGATMAADGFGEDPWAVVQGGDVSRESPVSGFLYMLCSAVVRLGFGSLLPDEPPRLAAALSKQPEAGHTPMTVGNSDGHIANTSRHHPRTQSKYPSNGTNQRTKRSPYPHPSTKELGR